MNKSTDQTISIKSGCDASFSSYKTDNAKLIKENNELHIEFIKMKEEYEGKLKGKFWLLKLNSKYDI